jgi:hypothetical protein
MKVEDGGVHCNKYDDYCMKQWVRIPNALTSPILRKRSTCWTSSHKNIFDETWCERWSSQWNPQEDENTLSLPKNNNHKYNFFAINFLVTYGQHMLEHVCLF